MQIGWERIGKKQAFGRPFNTARDAACALGCVYLGMDKRNIPNDDVEIYSKIKNKFKEAAGKTISCLPQRKYNNSLLAQIFMCNDSKKMSIPDIIAGLRDCKL